MAESKQNKSLIIFSKQDWLCYALIFAATILSYWSVLSVDFVFDTPLNLHDAALQKYIQSINLKSILTGSRAWTWLTFAFNYELSGLNPFWFRLTNVVINALCGCAVYILVKQLAGLIEDKQHRWKQSEISLEGVLIALFLVLHPISEFVTAYVVQRFVLLATLFALISVSCLLQGLLTKNQSQIMASD